MTKKHFTIFAVCLLVSYQQTITAKTLFYSPETKKKVEVKKEAKKKKYSLGGQITLKDRLHDSNVSLGASVTWKPDSKDYWFIKGSFKHNFDDSDEGFSYNYGLGYDDWHVGTWTVQVNDYSTKKLGEKFNLDNAILSVGYKVKSETLKKLKLSSTVTVAKRTKGDPSLSVSVKWQPITYWFIKGIHITPLEGGGDSYWNYLFGYDDWHPGTFGFEYSNYGTNPLMETNFRKGSLALMYKYKYK